MGVEGKWIRITIHSHMLTVDALYGAEKSCKAMELVFILHALRILIWIVILKAFVFIFIFISHILFV